MLESMWSAQLMEHVRLTQYSVLPQFYLNLRLTDVCYWIH